MADDLNLNRQAFVQPSNPQPKSSLAGILGPVIIILVIAACGLLGYKIIAQTTSAHPASSQQLAQMQKQLAEMDKRLDRLERRRGISAIPTAAARNSSAEKSAQKNPGERTEKPAPAMIATKSAPAAQTKTPLGVGANEIASAAANSSSGAVSGSAPNAKASFALPPAEARAHQEEWQATANQLADVVDTIGSQQNQLSRATAELGRLAGQSQRTAVQFTLHRGANPQRVGPVSMQLRKSDSRTQRYTLYVYVNDRRIVFSDRAANEVIDFALSAGAAPMKLLATKVSGNSVAGYLEVPVAQH